MRSITILEILWNSSGNEMTFTSALLWFFFPFIGSYIGVKLSKYFNKTDKLIDPEDPACWNYSEARLRRMK